MKRFLLLSVFFLLIMNVQMAHAHKKAEDKKGILLVTFGSSYPETRVAFENIDKIVAYCDGLMVARGDLGVEIPAQEVPLIQKQLVLRAKKARIPVIIATQMMESMINNLTPTRAEVNDVANSVMDGADAVMLSGETSVGEYPVEVIKAMRSIIVSVEDSELIEGYVQGVNCINERYISKAVCSNAAKLADEIEAAAIDPATTVESLSLPPARSEGKIVETVDELIDALKNEAKVL